MKHKIESLNGIGYVCKVCRVWNRSKREFKDMKECKPFKYTYSSTTPVYYVDIK